MSNVRQDIRVYEALIALHARLEHLADTARALRDEAKHDLAVRMADEEIESTGAGGYVYVPTEKTYGVVQDKEAFIAWAREHAPEMITGTPRKQLINEKVVQCLDSGEPLPPGLGYFPKPDVSRRKR